MSDTAERTFTGDFRRFFLRGLVVVLPSVLTLWIVVKAYQFVDNTIAEPINRGVRVAMVNTARVWTPLQAAFDPSEEEIAAESTTLRTAGTEVPPTEVLRARLRTKKIQVWWTEHWFMDWIGLVIAIVAVYIAGRLLGGFFGRRIYRKIEDLITTLPIFKQVYPYVKQIVQFLFSDEQPIKFNRVVACEYPRKGIWSVGFQTGATLKSIQTKAGDAVTIFIPSSPTPFTGYTITVQREDIIELPITVEEAIRFSVSGGVLVPAREEASSTLGQASAASVTKSLDLPSGLIPIPGAGPDGTSAAEAATDQPDKATATKGGSGAPGET